MDLTVRFSVRDNGLNLLCLKSITGSGHQPVTNICWRVRLKCNCSVTNRR